MIQPLLNRIWNPLAQLRSRFSPLPPDCFSLACSSKPVTVPIAWSSPRFRRNLCQDHQSGHTIFKMPPTPKIHILGLGNLGRLFAHALATQPGQPPIVLLFHRPSMEQEWEAADREIQITTKDVISSSSNYEVEVIDAASQCTEPIENLIITTKTLNTVKALKPIANRLNVNSTLLFAQNGMGTVEEVTSSLFPNPATRPAYLAAITSHGVFSTAPFRSVHAGQAHIIIGRVTPQFQLEPYSQSHAKPSPTSISESIQSPHGSSKSWADFYLQDRLFSSPILSATSVQPQALKYAQLEKLTVNAIINPLTAIFRLKNGELLQHTQIRKLVQILVCECSQILLALPELRNVPYNPDQEGGFDEDELGEKEKQFTLSLNQEIDDKFSPKRLERLVEDVSEKTAANTSSMLQDVRAGRQTEIEYINGYFVRRAKEVGVECANHEVLLGMVRDGKQIGIGEVESWFPDVGRPFPPPLDRGFS